MPIETLSNSAKRNLILLLIAGALAGLVAVLSGCGSSAAANSATLSQDTYNKVNVGSSSDSLKTLAGEPARTEHRTVSQMPGMVMSGDMQVDYWYYQGSKGWVRFEISEGRVTAKSGY